jgi:hypothetical protein
VLEGNLYETGKGIYFIAELTVLIISDVLTNLFQFHIFGERKYVETAHPGVNTGCTD